MVGHVAAPVAADQLGPDRRRRHQHVGEIGPDPEGVDVGVLEQEQVVVGRREQRLLQGVGVPVPDPPEPAGAERPVHWH